MSYVKSFSARYADEGTVYEQLTKIFPMVTGITIIVRKHHPSNTIGSQIEHSLILHAVSARPLHLHHTERAHRCKQYKLLSSFFALVSNTLQDETRAIKAAIKATHYVDETL